MDPKDIHLDDWRRILIGDVPGVYFIEIIIRCVLCYAIVVVGIRLMGKRMAGQLSRNEVASLVLTAAAIGIPVTSPDRGIVPGIIIAAIIVIGERWISARIASNDKLEKGVKGNVRTIVRDGYLVIQNMTPNRISRDRVFAELRVSGLKHLGAVKRFYFEADGSFALIQNDDKKYGLSVLPDFDEDMIKEQKHTDKEVCFICGMDKEDMVGEEPPRCPNCGNNKYVKAMED